MGKFFERFNKIGKGIDTKANSIANKLDNRPQKMRGGRLHSRVNETMGEGIHEGIDTQEMTDPLDDNYDDERDDDVWIQPSQRPESFHHFILENQYKDLERSIRGFKDIFEKETQTWRTIRKSEHCFTDEEAEEILRTAQSHLATDIKLSYINKEVFGLMMMTIYKRLDELFYSIAEYRYGRYGNEEKQYQMKLQNRKIFLELWTRVQANYSRAIQGQENKYTHDSVKAQESLQNSGQDPYENKRYT